MSEKKVGKRLLTWVLVLVMTLSLLPLNVLAANPAVMRVVRPDTDKYITYKFYNGEAEVDEQIIKTGDTLLEPEIETQKGKRLKGWYTAQENGDLFTGFGNYTSEITESTTINLYARFEDVYYVYFTDTTGRIVATKEGKSGDGISVNDVKFPVGNDESITGWYLEDDTNKTPVPSVTLSNTNVTLCAIVENGYWITFESDSGSYVAPQFVRSGEPCTAPSDPTKPGYDFAGWYKDGTKFTFDSSLTENLTLTAHWTEKKDVQYTVIHWLENADNDEYSIKKSESKIGTAGNPTAATAKSYDGFTAQAITQKVIAGDGSTIVNVYYKRNVYEVKFYSRYGNSEYKDLRITAKYGAYIGDKWPTQDGSSSWYVSTRDSKAQVNIDTMPLNGKSFYGPQKGLGKSVAYYYTEVLPGQSGIRANDGRMYKEDHQDVAPKNYLKVTKEDQYDILGFKFVSSISTKTGRDYNGAKFYYSRNDYNIIFINGGNTEKTESKKYQQDISTVSYTPTAPAGKEGYEFAGWFDNELCEGRVYDFTGKTMPANNITLYAKWVEPVHTVTFMVGEMTYETIPDVAHKGTITLPAAPKAPDGDTFLGWVDANGKPFHPSTKITGDLKLYAKFGNKAGYSVTYVTEGSSSVTDDKLYAEDAYATVRNGPSTAPKDEVFLYWTNNGKKYYLNDKVLVPKGGVTLTAVYGPVAQALTLTYHANYPEGLTAPDPATKTRTGLKNNECITVAADNTFPAPAGYEFDCWNTKADGTGDKFAAGSSARVDNIDSNDLYARWKSTQITDEIIVTIKGNTSTVTYDGTEKSVTGYTVESSDNRYTENYFTFTGTATATGTDAGTYPMGLKPENFENKNANFSKVTFVVTDGSLTINPIDKVTVTIKGNTGSETYNGEEQSVTGYTVESISNNLYTSSDFSLKEGVIAKAKGTDANTAYLMNLTSDSFDNKSQNFSNVEFDVTDGSLTITKRNIVVTANDVTVPYDGNPHGGNGCTADNLVEGHNVTATITGSETNVGVYKGKLDPSNATITNQSGTNVTNNYNIAYVPGTLTITKRTETATVTITGNHNSVKYNGREQSVTGFTYTAPEGVTVALRDSFKAEAKGTNVGTYKMDLTSEYFTVTSNIYEEFKIVVNDGYLEITRSGGHHPRPKPTVEIEDDDALGLNTTDHFAYIVGYGNGEVRPQNNITRAEVATIFFRLLTDDVRDENLTKTNRYSDVTRADWYNTAVSTLSSMGIITGYPDGTFRPNAAITRAEFAAIAARFDSNGDKTTAKFSDIATHWAKDEISIAYNNGWITGYPNGTFGPQRDITRAETMTLVNRVLNRLPETEEDLLPNMTVWTDNANPNAWYYLAVQEATNSHYYKFKTNSKYEKWTELRETRDWTQLEK